MAGFYSPAPARVEPWLPMLAPVSWEPELEELRRREELARRMGGEERVARQHASGRLTVRERIERLLRRRLVPRDGCDRRAAATYDATAS